MQIQQPTPSEEEKILRTSTISIFSNKGEILKYINDQFLILKKSSTVVKHLESIGVWSIIDESIDKSKLLIGKKTEILYAYVYGYVDNCSNGNNKKFVSYSVGYTFCGPANKCQCTRNAVSDSVRAKKKLYTDEQNAAINEKRSRTNIEKFGIDNLFKDAERIKQANIAKYGVSSPMHRQEVKDKIASTNIERYGGIAPANNKEVVKKIRQTIETRYTTDQRKDFVRKAEQTFLSKYGVKNPNQTKEIRDKIKKTCLDKYGVDNAAKSQLIVDKIKQAQRVTNYRRLADRLFSHNVAIESGESFTTVLDHANWKCTACSNTFIGTAFNGKIPRCPTCYPSYISSGQVDLINFLLTFLNKNEIIINDRTILFDLDDRRKNQELDIVIPKYNIAIEYCGLRYHTEIFGNKNKTYHYNKWKRCYETGIKLITINSDDWRDQNDLLKSMIKARIGISTKIFARNTVFKEIQPDIARSFFEKNHINGYVNSKYNFGLFLEDQLVMCMSFSKPRFSKTYDVEITRMATIKHHTVIGGATKLFKNAEKLINFTSVISYCDLRYGSGNSYLSMGFTKLSTPTIGYEYVEISNPYQRYNRMKFQKHKLNIPEHISEAAHMYNNGYDRIWDCGHQKFIWIASIK